MNIKKTFFFIALAIVSTAIYTRNHEEALELGIQFLKSQNLKDQSQFKSIINSAVSKYRGNKEAFFEFIDIRDGYGCTSLLRAAALRDMKQIVYILEKLEEYYGIEGRDIMDVFNFINAQCLQGHTAFYLLAQNGSRQDAELMLYHVIRILGSQKELFVRFLKAPTYEDGWTVLHWLAYQGSMVNLEVVVKVAERILGKNSMEFDAIINAVDIYGLTPLDNTYFNARHRQFLIQHGAVTLHGITPELLEARKLGLSLIDAIRDDQFSTMQQMLVTAQTKYKDNPRLFFELMMTRSPAGWDPLMHAAALSYEYTALLLHVIKHFFSTDEEAFYSILRNVAQDGRGALIIAILQRNFDIANLLIKTIQNYSPSKFFLYILLDIRTYVKGFTPLLAAVNFSLDQKVFNDIIKTLIAAIANPFGKDSRPVWLFVNSRDLDGYPPLAYATAPDVIEILKGYGAQLEKLPF